MQSLNHQDVPYACILKCTQLFQMWRKITSSKDIVILYNTENKTSSNVFSIPNLRTL